MFVLVALSTEISYTVITGVAAPSITKEGSSYYMYDIYFSYFDGNDHLCTNVDKIEIPTSSGIRTYSGDEIASQHFRIHSEIYLYSSSTSYTISTTGLKAIEIRKK